MPKAATQSAARREEARGSVMARPSSAQVDSPGRSFPRAQRWPIAMKRQTRKSLDSGSPEAVGDANNADDSIPVKHESAQFHGEEQSTTYSSFRPSSAVSFRRSPRITAPSSSLLAEAAVPDTPAVGAYEVKRFPHANDLKQVKGFGAATEKRCVMWGPTYTAPSSAVPTAWNSSRHYAKQKKRVEGMAAKRRSVSKSSSAEHSLKSSASSPILPAARSLPSMTGSHNTAALDSDPLAWLRQQPNGEQRANFLATKFGLTDLVKQPVAHSAGQRRYDPPATKCATTSIACGNDTNGKGDEAGGEVIAAATAMPQLQRQQSFTDMREGDDPTANPDGLMSQHVAQRGQRLTVCCRLPGGMILTVHTYSRGKLRGLKTAIVRRCRQRFASESDFDVFSLNGRLLGNLDATLVDVGLAVGDCTSSTSASSSSPDNIMVQIIPRHHLPAAADRQSGGQM
jgi:hypothetical protein